MDGSLASQNTTTILLAGGVIDESNRGGERGGSLSLSWWSCLVVVGGGVAARENGKAYEAIRAPPLSTTEKVKEQDHCGMSEMSSTISIKSGFNRQQ